MHIISTYNILNNNLLQTETHISEIVVSFFADSGGNKVLRCYNHQPFARAKQFSVSNNPPNHILRNPAVNTPFANLARQFGIVGLDGTAPSTTLYNICKFLGGILHG